MKTLHERILLVENDPDISELVGRQTLQALGYRVDTLRSAGAALQEAARSTPDLILADLKLPGLSGKDLLAGLVAQGIDVPVMLIAPKGMEADVIQAFRLGAVDYLLWPCREAEIVSAVERVLEQVRARREREALAEQLKHANAELQRRVREQTTLAAFGKGITATLEERALFDKIVEGALYLAEADSGWLLLSERPRESLRNSHSPAHGKRFVLAAQRNLPTGLYVQVGQPWDDGISALAALSGESMALHGEPLQQLAVQQLAVQRPAAPLGKAALVTPVKVKREVIGLLVVTRKAPQPFHPGHKALLEAAAEYAAIAITNARRFSSLQEAGENQAGSPRPKSAAGGPTSHA